MRDRIRGAMFAGMVAVALMLAARVLMAQNQSGAVNKSVQFPEYDQQHRLKSLITAVEARQQPDQQWKLQSLHVETYEYPKEAKETNMIVEAPDCLFSMRTRVATSDGPILARAADGRFSVEGRGFEWQHTNAYLAISNDAHTIIKKEQMQQGKQPAVPGTVSTNKPRGDMHVYSDKFDFDNRNGIALYRGHVRASDGVMKMSSGVLRAKLAPGGHIENLVATENVVVEQDDSRATGDRAEYTVSDTAEIVVMTGNATWRNAGAEGTGDVLLMDRKANTFVSTGHSWARLVQAAKTNATAAASTTRMPGSAPRTNAPPAEVTCVRLTAQLPPTNGPVQKVVAEQQVVIKQGESRAEGEHAVYDTQGGREWMELTGNPKWATDRLQGRGKVLQWDRTANHFMVNEDAYLKVLPASSATNQIKSTNSPTSSQPIEVYSASYDFQPGEVHFVGGVRAESTQWKMRSAVMDLGLTKDSNQIQDIVAKTNVVVEQILIATNASASGPWRLASDTVSVKMASPGERVDKVVARDNVVVEPAAAPKPGTPKGQWKLTSGDATLQMATNGNQIDNIQAKDRVVVHQLNGGSRTNQLPWKLTGEWVNVKLGTNNNHIEHVLARENVVVEQVKPVIPNDPTPPWKLHGQVVNADFQGTNNTVSLIVAEQQVVIDRGPNQAKGQKAVYTADTGWMELTGEPTLLIIPPPSTSPNSKAPKKVFVTGADVLMWNQTNNVFKAKGNYVGVDPDAPAPKK